MYKILCILYYGKNTLLDKIVFIDSNIAMWMGWVTFCDINSKTTKVDKSWGYKPDDDGIIRIILHHSSLPYPP